MTNHRPHTKFSTSGKPVSVSRLLVCRDVSKWMKVNVCMTRRFADISSVNEFIKSQENEKNKKENSTECYYA